VKYKTQANKSEKRTYLSFQSLFLNVSIFILSIVVIFLSYTLLIKLNFFKSVSENENSEKHLQAIQVEVLNGCGVTGIADRITDSLRVKNVDVVNTGNYRSFDIDNTIVIDRTGNLTSAKYVAQSIGINERQIIQQKNKNYFLDVTVIVGKDYNQLFQNQ